MVHLPIPVIYTIVPSNDYIPRIFLGQGRIFTSRSGLQLDSPTIPRPAVGRYHLSACSPALPVKPLRRHRFVALRVASHEVLAAAAAVLEVPLRSSSHGFAWGLRLRTSALCLTSEDMVDDALRPGSAGPQAFVRWPKVVSPTVAPRSHCPSLEGRWLRLLLLKRHPSALVWPLHSPVEGWISLNRLFSSGKNWGVINALSI